MEIALIMLFIFGEEIVDDMYMEDVVFALRSIYLSTIVEFNLIFQYFNNNYIK